MRRMKRDFAFSSLKLVRSAITFEEIPRSWNIWFNSSAFSLGVANSLSSTYRNPHLDPFKFPIFLWSVGNKKTHRAQTGTFSRNLLH